MLSGSFGNAVAYPRPFGAITPGGTYSEYSLNSIATPPWNPNGSGTYMRITGSGSPSPNPGVGFYDCVPGMYGALIVGGWVRWISGTFFMFRMNDSHSGQTFGTDCAAISIQGTSPSGQLLFDMDAQTSPASIVANTWYYYEWFNQQGTTSGIPQGAYSFKFYDSSGTLLWTVANANFNNNQVGYNIDSITLDCELGGSTPLVDFGPYVIIDPQTNGIAAMRGPLSFTTVQATTDSTPLQFTPSSAGTHAPLVSVPLPNSAYVQDATVSDADTYSFGNVTSGTGVATYQAYAQSEALAVGARNAQAQTSGDFVMTGPTHKAPVNNFGIILDVIGSESGTLNIGAGPKVGY